MSIAMSRQITTLFLDIGGVLLTNGWDHGMRQRAAEVFGLDLVELNDRHHLTFDTYEQGKLSLDEYLQRVVFWQARSFAAEDFKRFMFEQSQPYPEVIELVRGLKSRLGLKVATLSNEGRELTVCRVEKFGLGGFVDFFICSCFVHCRKPDPQIYHMALDIAQVRPEQVAYVEDRLMFIEVARSLGIRSIHHQGLASTRLALAELGLSCESG
jgi:putative hydrolase of the HAD superfamily